MKNYEVEVNASHLVRVKAQYEYDAKQLAKAVISDTYTAETSHWEVESIKEIRNDYSE